MLRKNLGNLLHLFRHHPDAQQNGAKTKASELIELFSKG
jgi:hypothetical protein